MLSELWAWARSYHSHCAHIAVLWRSCGAHIALLRAIWARFVHLRCPRRIHRTRIAHIFLMRSYCAQKRACTSVHMIMSTIWACFLNERVMSAMWTCFTLVSHSHRAPITIRVRYERHITVIWAWYECAHTHSHNALRTALGAQWECTALIALLCVIKKSKSCWSNTWTVSTAYSLWNLIK